MARDEIRRERDPRDSCESSSKRRRERSYDNHSPETSSSHHQSFRCLCVRKISLNYDADYVQEQLRKAFLPFRDVEIRTFKSSDRRLAIINFRHSDDAHRALKNKSQVYICDRSFNVEIWDERESLMRGIGRRHEKSNSPHQHHGFSYSKPTSSSVHRSSDLEERSRSPIRSSNRRPYNYGRGNRPDSMEHEPLNDPKATRTLFVGSLEPDIADAEVRHAFERCGGVEQVDVKHPNNSHAYAFVRFVNLDMAIQAKNKMNGNSIRSYHCKIGYGKPLLSNVLYISGLDNWRDAEELECFLNQFGTLVKLDWQYRQNYAVATFQSIEVAEEVNQQLKNLASRYPDRKLMVDFIEGELMKEVIPPPRQSSLMPLPNPFPIVQELIPNLRGNSLAFSSQFAATAFDLMRGNADPNPALFQSNLSAEDSRQRRNLPRQMESSNRINPLTRRPPQGQSSWFGRGASPIDSFLRQDMSDLSDPVLSSITTMPDLEAFLRPHIWSARLYTKKSLFQFRCFHVVGDETLSKELSKCPSFVSQDGDLNLQMPHQARTEATWMADAIEQIGKALAYSSNSSPPPFSVLLALQPSQESEKGGSGEMKIEAKRRPITCLVSYLRLKQRAGFLVPFSNYSDESSKYTILLLTPSSFAISLLKFSAPRLSSNLAFVDDFLVLLLLRN
ncbi:unnamed protein product [Hymenolepis diminuta]|uniref:RNA-binding protein n=2 Tax=Hymenolepis diminuta TaxID=6216 RepID=A0A0R3SD29_HYMDI|nr:unnamed protein product [Hymenolepis diminuta]